MNQNDLKRVQQIDYELLCAVDDICKRHGIEYFIIYGTLIGAIRHNGPIPWDDDIDIGMTRENYIKFFDVAKKELDDTKYFIKVMGSGSLDYVSELKLGDKHTLYCMPGCEDKNTMNSVTLDVFCFDSLKYKSPQSHNLRFKLWLFFYWCKQNYDEKILLMKCIDRSSKNFKVFYKFGLNIMHLVRCVVGEKNLEWIGYKLFVDQTNTSGHYYVVSGLVKTIFRKEWFESMVEVKYNGRMFPAPKGYHDILTMEYGDYMQLPPEDKRLRNYFNEWVFKEI